MRSTICLVLIFLCCIYSTAKKNPDEDFAEFDDFDQDEFTVDTEISSSTTATPISSKPEKSIDNEDLSQPESSKTKDDEVTIDDDDDDAMFDEEEFEMVLIYYT